MKVAIDKNCTDKIQDFNEFEYIYVFDDEPLKKLCKIKTKCVNYKNVDEVDVNLTDYPINCLKKAKVTDANWKELPKYRENKIAIVIPNCNYSHILDKCLQSIVVQTYKNYEIVFVDDMSTDNSVEIVEKYVDKVSCLKIIQLKQKRYNGGARNEAYLHLSDDVDYVMYLDSDDWLRHNNVLKKINRNLQENPDVLFIGIASYTSAGTYDTFTPDYKDKYEAIKSWSGSCGKVIKKNLATKQECLYNEGTLKEDRNQHCRICIYMNSFKCMPECVYVWNRTNSKSVTSVRDKIFWHTSTIRHYADTMQLCLQEKGKDAKIDAYLEERLNKTKREVETGGDAQW